MLNFVRTLTLRQLQIFAAAARHVSFVRAAQELHLTQPAVSMQIKQLEEAVGLPLFERIARRIVLTEAGATLAHYAQRILGEVKDAQDALQSLSLADSGAISVGLVSTARYFVPQLIARYCAQFPKVEVRFTIAPREPLLRMLQDNAIDLAVMGRPPRDLDAIAEPLAYNPQVIVAARDHAFAAVRRIDVQELRHETFLMREPGSGTRTVVEQMFKHHLFTPAKVVTLDSNETIKQAVMAGMGISLLSLHTLRLELRTREIALLDVCGTPIDRAWQIVHLNARQLSPTCQSFRRFVLENTETYLAGEYVDLPTHPVRIRQGE
ncbi:HTH-type transcriptional regulator CfxR [Paraburkholderia sacchari]|uniref:LysR family transcriptional regulator n=1 Tax=Paraburkholderia sacchari TaxID=159450 RepID=UPI0039A62A59